MLVWKHKRPRIAKAKHEKENGARGIRFPGFRLYYKASYQHTKLCHLRRLGGPEIVIQNEGSQKDKNKHCMLIDTCGIQTSCTDGLIFTSRNRDTGVENDV